MPPEPEPPVPAPVAPGAAGVVVGGGTAAGVTVMVVRRNNGSPLAPRQKPDTVWSPAGSTAGMVTVARATPSSPARPEPSRITSTPNRAKVAGRQPLMVTVTAWPGAGVESSTVSEAGGGGYVWASAGTPPATTSTATAAAATANRRLLMLFPLKRRPGRRPPRHRTAWCYRVIYHRVTGWRRVDARVNSQPLGAATVSTRSRSSVVSHVTVSPATVPWRLTTSRPSVACTLTDTSSAWANGCTGMSSR